VRFLSLSWVLAICALVVGINANAAGSVKVIRLVAVQVSQKPTKAGFVIRDNDFSAKKGRTRHPDMHRRLEAARELQSRDCAYGRHTHGDGSTHFLEIARHRIDHKRHRLLLRPERKLAYRKQHT
jgi:hypothetical protein